MDNRERKTNCSSRPLFFTSRFAANKTKLVLEKFHYSCAFRMLWFIQLLKGLDRRFHDESKDKSGMEELKEKSRLVELIAGYETQLWSGSDEEEYVTRMTPQSFYATTSYSKENLISVGRYMDLFKEILTLMVNDKFPTIYQMDPKGLYMIVRAKSKELIQIPILHMVEKWNNYAQLTGDAIYSMLPGFPVTGDANEIQLAHALYVKYSIFASQYVEGGALDLYQRILRNMRVAQFPAPVLKYLALMWGREVHPSSMQEDAKDSQVVIFLCPELPPTESKKNVKYARMGIVTGMVGPAPPVNSLKSLAEIDHELAELDCIFADQDWTAAVEKLKAWSDLPARIQLNDSAGRRRQEFELDAGL